MGPFCLQRVFKSLSPSRRAYGMNIGCVISDQPHTQVKVCNNPRMKCKDGTHQWAQMCLLCIMLRPWPFTKQDIQSVQYIGNNFVRLDLCLCEDYWTISHVSTSSWKGHTESPGNRLRWWSCIEYCWVEKAACHCELQCQCAAFTIYWHWKLWHSSQLALHLKPL